MKKQFMTLLLSSMTLPGISYAGLEDALSNVKFETEKVDGQGVNTSSLSSTPVNITDSQEAPVVCKADQQTSLPYKTFLLLFKNRDLNISHSSSTGKIMMNGGDMIGNCSDMIRYNFSKPNSQRNSYLFQVEIKIPTGCPQGEKCNYTVYKGEDGIAVDEEVKQYEPNYFGFEQCLKDTGVISENGSVDKSKIAWSDFNYVQDNADETAPLWFYSHGPKANQVGGVYSDNKLKENSCGFYEDITEGGMTLLSKADERRINKENLFNEICNSGDYKRIDQLLPEFREYQEMYNILKEIRNIELKKEVQNLHKELAAKDLSELDADNFKRVTSDFYRYVIDEKRKDLDKAILRLSKANSKNKKIKQKQVDALIKELMVLNRAPYLNQSDFKKMKNFEFKAPLHKEAWREAALNVYKGNNVTYNYTRFAGDKKDGYSTGRRSLKVVRKDIQNDVAEQKNKIEELGELAENPKKSYAAEKRQKVQSVLKSVQLNNQGLQQYVQSEMQYLYSHCYNQNKYWVNRQRCAQEVQLNVQEATMYTQQFNQNLQGVMQNLNSQASAWDAVEKARNAAYGYTPAQTSAANIPGHVSNTGWYNGRTGERIADPTQLVNLQQRNLVQQQYSPIPQGASNQLYVPYQNAVGVQPQGQAGAGAQWQFQAGYGRTPSAYQQYQSPSTYQYHQNSYGVRQFR